MARVVERNDDRVDQLVGSGGSPVTASRHRRRKRRLLILSLAGVLLLAAPAYSFSHAVLQSNGDPFSVKATEWARDHALGWLVDRVESFWYSHHQPPVGGVPKNGIPVPRTSTSPSNATTAHHHPRHTTVAASKPACPKPITPFTPSALPNEGVFAPVGRLNGAVCFAYMRPDAIHTSVVVGVAWMNMRSLSATLHNGTELPGGGPWMAGSQVAPQDYARVVATFNSGFRLDSSRGGYYTEDRTVKALVAGRASLVIRANGTVDVGMWGRDDAAGPNIVSVRQNLDLIVDQGTINPAVTAGPSSEWGATLGNHIFTWRSGVGVDAAGNLIYVAGPGLDVESLAAVLQRAGAQRAMELDINPYWTTLMAYDSGSPLPVPTKLLSSMQRSASRYLSSGTRDFIELDSR